MKLYDFIMEMATWFTPSPELAEKALRADKNGLKPEDIKYLKTLERKWGEGFYDNDHNYLIDELKIITNKY